jgi:hypothetical protein
VAGGGPRNPARWIGAMPRGNILALILALIWPSRPIRFQENRLMRALPLPAALLALMLGLMLSLAPAQAAQSARDFVTAIYKTYVGKNATGISMDSKEARKLVTPGLMKLIDADAKAAAKRQEVPTLDGDPFVDAQDFEIKSFTVDIKELGPVKATATVSFENEASRENKPVVLDLMKVGGEWRIDDFRDGQSGSLRKILSKQPSR